MDLTSVEGSNSLYDKTTRPGIDCSVSLLKYKRTIGEASTIGCFTNCVILSIGVDAILSILFVTEG